MWALTGGYEGSRGWGHCKPCQPALAPCAAELPACRRPGLARSPCAHASKARTTPPRVRACTHACASMHMLVGGAVRVHALQALCACVPRCASRWPAGFSMTKFTPLSQVKDSDQLFFIAYPSFNPREELSATYEIYQKAAKDRSAPMVVFNGAVCNGPVPMGEGLARTLLSMGARPPAWRAALCVCAWCHCRRAGSHPRRLLPRPLLPGARQAGPGVHPAHGHRILRAQLQGHTARWACRRVLHLHPAHASLCRLQARMHLLPAQPPGPHV